jgi:hypothetical protein
VHNGVVHKLGWCTMGWCTNWVGAQNGLVHKLGLVHNGVVHNGVVHNGGQVPV